jgi:glycosyltransferase involved in cell wall biosynthesis
LRRLKFAQTCRLARCVTAGNETIARAAEPFAARVDVVPTPVDASSFPEIGTSTRDAHTLVWIGLPENLYYLELLRPTLAALAGDFPKLRIRIICSRFPDWPEIPVEAIEWSPQSEVDALSTASIGLMPLTDDDWTRGKCAFKLLQYMAAGLPCVASPVGANSHVVLDGETGFLSTTPEDWARSLRELLSCQDVRARLGAAGRRRALHLYDRKVIVPRVADLYADLVHDLSRARGPAGKSHSAENRE